MEPATPDKSLVNPRRRFLLGVRGSDLPRMEINPSCLARQGVYCQSCRDACESRAIGFLPRVGAVPVPVVDLAACSACGACVPVCPTQAVTVRPPNLENNRA